MTSISRTVRGLLSFLKFVRCDHLAVCGPVGYWPVYGQVAWDCPRDPAVGGSHAPGVSTGEPCASAATRRVQGAPAAAAADGDRSDLLGSAVEAVDELAAFVAGGPAADRGWLAPAGISTLLGVEESATIRSAGDQCGPPTPDSANELRQSSVGRAKNSR